jgi:hypothetical protein
MSNGTIRSDRDSAAAAPRPDDLLADLIGDPSLYPTSARELILNARKIDQGSWPHSTGLLRRAAKTIELQRLKLWNAERQLAISEAARAAEDDDQAEAEAEARAEAVGVFEGGNFNFLAEVAAALPPGTRCSIHLERERGLAECRREIGPATMTITP